MKNLISSRKRRMKWKKPVNLIITSLVFVNMVFVFFNLNTRKDENA